MKFLWRGTSDKFPRKTKRTRGIVVLVGVLSVLALAWISLSSKPKFLRDPGDFWTPEENQANPVIGDLGGVPVAIPKPYAHLVEYDGDPGFMESRKGALPERTYQSKLRSFGFEIRYPDMAALTDETAQQKKQENIYTTTWMRVSVSSGSDYAGDPTEGHINSKINLRQAFPPYRYEKSPHVVHGLTMYTPVGFDESARRSPSGWSTQDENIYFHRDRDGKADAYIECSNASHAAAPCRLKFNMAPAMLANVSVGFRKGLLPHSKEIQSSVTGVILGFRVNPPAVTTTQKGK